MTDKPENPRISGKEATHVAMEAQEYGPVRICAADDSTLHSNMDVKPRISGKDATNVAMEAEKYGPVHIGASDSSASRSDSDQEVVQVPAPTDGARGSGNRRKAPPPRVRKPSPIHDQFLAPTPDLAGYRARLREAFGNTMSDEFVEVMLGKVIEALKPSPFDQLDEPTLNAALAIIDSVQCRSELEAFIAVEIVATGFSGLRFLRQSHKNMTEEYISVYGNYANKLLRLQLDLMRTLDRHRRGHKQTVEVRHVHLHSGAQGVVGIVNAAGEDHATRPAQK
jgi:hypothetical protein